MPQTPRKLTSLELLLVFLLGLLYRLGIITAAQVVNSFGPDVVMKGFEKRPDRRAQVLNACLSMKLATAAGKSPAKAAEEIEEAFLAGDTTCEEFLMAVGFEDIVRHQNPISIWDLIVESGWVSLDKPQHREALIGFVDKAVELLVFSYRQLVEAIGLSQFASDKVPDEKRTDVLDGFAGSKHKDLDESARTKLLYSRFPMAEIVKCFDWNVSNRVFTWFGHEFKLVVVTKEEKAVEPSTEAPVAAPPVEPAPLPPEQPSATGDSPEDEAPDPAGVGPQDEEEILEIDADAPSGVHPDVLAGLPTAAPANPFGHLGTAPSEGDGKPKPMFAPATPGSGKLSIPDGHKPPPSPSLLKRCQLKVASAQEALLKAHGELGKAQKTRDRKFTAESDLAATAALAAEAAATEALKKANHELEEALKAGNYK